MKTSGVLLEEAGWLIEGNGSTEVGCCSILLFEDAGGADGAAE
jgi:hypothetical protein